MSPAAMGAAMPAKIATPPVVGTRRASTFTCPSTPGLSIAPTRRPRARIKAVPGSEITKPTMTSAAQIQAMAGV